MEQRDYRATEDEDKKVSIYFRLTNAGKHSIGSSKYSRESVSLELENGLEPGTYFICGKGKHWTNVTVNVCFAYPVSLTRY